MLMTNNRSRLHGFDIIEIICIDNIMKASNEIKLINRTSNMLVEMSCHMTYLKSSIWRNKLWRHCGKYIILSQSAAKYHLTIFRLLIRHQLDIIISISHIYRRRHRAIYIAASFKILITWRGRLILDHSSEPAHQSLATYMSEAIANEKY